ncbi:MAG: hypothetical protein C0407_12615 [Desulfobacca sp.]|nr:hypothetical protein [Desulfobacca sp.]
MNRSIINIFCTILLLFFLMGVEITRESLAQQPSGRVMEKKIPGQETRYIDAHNHLSGIVRPGVPSNFSGAAQIALAEMDGLGIQKIIVMPPPFSPGHRGLFDLNDLLPLARQYPDRIAVLGGGGSLNGMIHLAGKSDSVSPDLKAQFEKTADEIISRGAIGFGELAVEHFSFASEHPYESVPADHPLFLLLADSAAKYNVPIDIHMEAVPQDMPLPDRRILKRSGNNPQTLKENISAFERLLDHNPKARIIWAHVGWCNTGFRTPTLCRVLFEKHPNLFMSFKLAPESLPETRPVSEDRKIIKPEWLQLMKDFPDRFILGTDQFYVAPGGRAVGPQKTEATKYFMTLLPPELARLIGIENPIRIFNLKK